MSMRSASDLAELPFRSATRAVPVPASRLRRSSVCEVAVIGAGPYGLAVAAHLKAARIETQVFGEAMGFWRNNMPKGMKLRSPWRASHIADPRDAWSLDRYVEAAGLKRAENQPIEQFIAYGEWFQRGAVPDLDPRKVEIVQRNAGGFRLRLEDGETIEARRVVIAMGLANQDFRPSEFEGLPGELVSHTCEHADLGVFRGHRVAVIGRGQSGCESAVLLSEAGADVELISRGDIVWIGSETPGAENQGWRWRLRELIAARGGVGPFPLDWLVDRPAIVGVLPAEWRDRLSIRSLRPAATAWLRPRAGAVRYSPGRRIVAARPAGAKISLELDNRTRAAFDHVLLATGYRIDVRRFGVLAPNLLAGIAQSDGYPVLDAGFEASVPGLHFAGSTALKSFGPLMRFVWGAGHAARAITRAVRARRP
jgi:cation diffusion facilitator CzcD-associated flavoprotein CzcO